MWRVLIAVLSFALTLGVIAIVANAARKRGWTAFDPEDDDPRGR